MTSKQILDYLAQEKRKHEKIARDAEKRLKEAPEGNLRVIRHGKGFQFFIRTDPGDKSGVYLPKSEHKKVIPLIQKQYDRKILAASGKQISVISRFIKYYDPDCLKSIYGLQSDIKKKYLSPAEIPDEEYAARWQQQEYIPKPFMEGTPEHFTNKGERVRSKSEVMIADALNNAGIPYKYECPLLLGKQLIHPDFTILRAGDRQEVYWEHLGMMDDPDYCLASLQRIRLYESKGLFPGINLILTMETGSVPINLSVIKQMIKTYCVV